MQEQVQQELQGLLLWEVDSSRAQTLQAGRAVLVQALVSLQSLLLVQ